MILGMALDLIDMDFVHNLWSRLSSSIKIEKRKKYILILGKGPKQILEHTLSAEKIHSINFTENNKKFCLSLYYNGANSYLFINVQALLNSKQKILKSQQLHYV